VIERFKGIAAALSSLTGLEISEATARAWARREHDPIPLKWFAGRPFISPAALKEWAARQDGQRKAKPETQSPQLPLLPERPQS
jgi:hypothetical protein